MIGKPSEVFGSPVLSSQGRYSLVVCLRAMSQSHAIPELFRVFLFQLYSVRSPVAYRPSLAPGVASALPMCHARSSVSGSGVVCLFIVAFLTQKDRFHTRYQMSTWHEVRHCRQF